MGLDCSHDAFHGAYRAFNRFRQAICKAMGGSYPPHKTERHADGTVLNPGYWYWGEGMSEQTHPGLYVLLAHSDCDGEISPEECVVVAQDLEALLPALDAMGSGGGHLERAGGYGGVARQFIAGCRQAAQRNESLLFE